MKTLSNIAPTPEQLVLVNNTRPIVIIRGSAGSGKTTTALLRLRQLVGFWLNRYNRMGIERDVRALVITYNRTLRGYISDLAKAQVGGRSGLELDVSTFGRWSKEQLPGITLLAESLKNAKLRSLFGTINLPPDFLLGEIEYLTGRFHAANLGDYVTCRRDGRGSVPRVSQSVRQQILDEVVHPYNTWKTAEGVADWNDLAVQIINMTAPPLYDIIIVDESQDFSANQVRALMRCAMNPSSVTFVLDAAQRIYPRGFTWEEAGVNVHPRDSFRLGSNHRNTKEICQFALPLLSGMDVGTDGTLPDMQSCQRHGPLPRVITGKYSSQLSYVIEHLSQHIDLSQDSVAFLKPRGGNWFSAIRSALHHFNYKYVEITRESEWPDGPENIALSTMYSAKGLEFDHVFILGLNEQVTPHGADPNDSTRDNLRRLLAMAITRARKTVMVGYKPTEASQLIAHLDASTYAEIDL